MEHSANRIPSEDVRRDIDVLLWSMKLYGVRRYLNQRFWKEETLMAQKANDIEPFPRLENVAEHSWHVADSVLLLGGHFRDLKIDHAAKLAILHDKMEIITGDLDPVGQDGTGLRAHAFNVDFQSQKDCIERNAIDEYLAMLRPEEAVTQASLLREVLERRTEEAKFVKAVDKLQAMSFVLVRKQGNHEDQHIKFTFRYSSSVQELYPGLCQHYKELRSRLINKIAERRSVHPSEIEAMVGG